MRTFVLYKPYGVLSQFTSEDGHPGLSSLKLGVPPTVWPAGRLDRDSEGMLLLTADNVLKRRLTDPAEGHSKTYWVQVEGVPQPEQLLALRNGVVIQGKPTRPARVRWLQGGEVPGLPERIPPIRVRASIPTSWLELSLTEGRNRQVRRMTAAVGHPCLRLIRYAVGPYRLEDLQPGEWRRL